jgi:GTP-binding protein
MFVDKAHIYIKGGKGGDGKVSFRKEKYVPAGGPDGGDGGKGGNIIAIVDSGLRTLMDFRYQTKYIAQDGENGKSKKMFGKDAEDLIIRVPQGTVIWDVKSNKILADMKNIDSKAVLARGGDGGKGNTHYKNSVRQAPNFSQPGFYGIDREIVLELKMLADVGLVGFPNVGKSTILSKVTKATPKIADYHFTTLFPNLGVVEEVRGKSFVMADIPGLIEGAHTGIGLGHDFLRHVERTKLILHVVDVAGVEGRDPIEDFKKINEELRLYSEKLAGRKQVVIGNKMDLVFDTQKVDEFVKFVKNEGYDVFLVSGATKLGINEAIKHVTYMLDDVEPIDLYSDADFISEFDEKIELNEVTYALENEVYIIGGVPLERLYYTTDFEDVESIRRFQNILMKKGVFERLKEMGISDGDTVKVFDLEFEYYE